MKLLRSLWEDIKGDPWFFGPMYFGMFFCAGIGIYEVMAG